MSRVYFFTGSGAPSSTPTYEGSVYVDTTNDRIYFATGTSSSSDWDLMPVNLSEITIDGDLDLAGVRKIKNALGLDFQASTELTISSGAITQTQTWHTIDTEGDAASDDLDTITIATDINFLAIRLEDNARVVTLKHGTGNLSLPASADVTMVANTVYLLMYDGSNWNLVNDTASAGSTLPVTDATEIVKGSIDATKKMRLEVDTNVTAATTRILTMRDADLDLTDVVTGPASATDNAIVRYDSGDGKIIQDSGITIDDSDNLSGVNKIESNDHLELTEIAAPATPATGKGAIYFKTDGLLYYKNDTGVETGFSGDVAGPGSSTDNGLVTFNGTTGKTVQDNTGVTVDDSGNFAGVGNIDMEAATTETRELDIGVGRSGNGDSIINLIGDATYTTYGARFYRFAGVNAPTEIRHRGTGNFLIVSNEASDILFKTNNTTRMTITSGGDIEIEGNINNNGTGGNNNCIGSNAGAALTTGANNTLIGDGAGDLITTGAQNVALGALALDANVSSNGNTALGYAALGAATTANNTAMGRYSLLNITSGGSNTGIGQNSGRYISGGVTANQTSGTSVYLGVDTKAGADGNSNEIVIGYDATGNGSNTVTLGNTSVTDVFVGSDNLQTLVAAGTDNDQTGTTYTLVLADQENKTVWMNNASANTLTIPLNATVAFAVGTKIAVMQEGAGQTTIDIATGGTINGTLNGSVVINNQYQGATLVKRATDTWIILGDVT